jgi:TP901 family phage tail tape measure protein
MAKTNIFIDGTQAGQTLKMIEGQVKKLNNEIRQLPRNSDAYKQKVKELGEASAALNKHRSDIKAVSDSYLPAKSNLKSLMGQMLPFAGVAGAITLAAQGVTTAIQSWWTNNKEMEKSLSSLRSITGASASDMEFYKEQAKEIGVATTLSATQAVEAFKLIGSARPDLLKDKEALAQVTKEAVILAEAAEMELAPAAQALASTMNQFNLGAEDSSRIINALAAGSVEGAAEIKDLTDTIDKAGTVMNSYNVSVEEGVALTELLSTKNIKGSEAGTQLRNVLLAMSTVKALDDKAVKELEKFGVNMDFVMDTSKPFNDRLKEMSKISGDQTALLRVFGKENITVGQTILQNVDQFEKLTDAVTGTNTAYVQAKINNDNLDGDLKQLSSAWEGLTLSTSAAQSPMRGIVQIGTEVLRWLTNVISLLTEWDDLKFEELLLDFTKALTYLNPAMFLFGDSLREAIDEQQRMNRLTQEVVKGMKSQADEAATLIKVLEANKKAMKDKSLTDMESTKISKENETIIAKLNEKYPELTKNYDLQTASSKELSKLQKEITNNLLEQSIAAVQATEAERILAEMVQLSMSIASQRAKEQNRMAATNFFFDIFTDDAEDLEEQLRKSQNQLEKLPETMKDVTNRVKGLNINFGEAFATQTSLIEKSVNKINRLKLQQTQFKDSFFSKFLDKQIKAEEQILKVLKAQAETEKKKFLEEDKKEAKEEEKKAKAEEAKAKAAEKAKQESDAAAQKWAELKKTLDDIIATSAKFKIDFDYEKQLAEFTDEFAKEMFVFENGIKSKYEKEIENARRLSTEKGKIGEDAAKELANLESLMTEELEFGKENIRKKYRTKGEEELDAYQQRQLELAEQYERSLMEVKVARAYATFESINKNDIKARKQANEQLKQVLIEQLEFESKEKSKALNKQLKEGLITEKEYDLLKEENERTLAEKIAKIHQNNQDEMLRLFQERFQKIIEGFSQVVDNARRIADAYFNIQKNNIDRDRNYAIQSEQEKLNQGIISREEFELKKQSIQAESDKKAHEMEVERAKMAKAFAVFQIALSTAEAVAKAVAASPVTFGLPFSAFAVTTGIAQTALALSEPMPQFMDGGFRNVVGADDGKTYKARQVSPLKGGMTPSQPSFALFSEKGPEYFVPNHLLQDARVANHVNAIEAIRTNQMGGTAPGSMPAGSMSDSQLLAMLSANVQLMTALNAKIPNMGVTIGDKQIDDLSVRTNELNSFKA